MLFAHLQYAVWKLRFVKNYLIVNLKYRPFKNVNIFMCAIQQNIISCWSGRTWTKKCYTTKFVFVFLPNEGIMFNREDNLSVGDFVKAFSFMRQHFCATETVKG